MLLVLFDVDGTLFVSHDPLVGRATCAAIAEVYGLTLPPDAIRRVDHAGRTARWITAELLRMEGLGDEEIAAGLDAWCDAVGGCYAALLSPAITRHWEMPKGTVEALTRVRSFARIALLTGNPEPIARVRMGHLGLAPFFPPGEGAFGCEGDERPELIALARRRAGDWPAASTLEVGDTPGDIAGAHEAGALSVAVCWSEFTREQLAGADAYAESMADLVDVLAALGGG